MIGDGDETNCFNFNNAVGGELITDDFGTVDKLGWKLFNIAREAHIMRVLRTSLAAQQLMSIYWMTRTFINSNSRDNFFVLLAILIHL